MSIYTYTERESQSILLIWMRRGNINVLCKIGFWSVALSIKSRL